ncbi:beta-N-acetylhexosaminidase [Streptomyces tsukubensis]|uniref:beta-N-acetylhexosaminidase n=1 Tax=Streptomyces tsukubensis TaxID=83656 RepID=UPI0026B7AE5C
MRPLGTTPEPAPSAARTPRGRPRLSRVSRLAGALLLVGVAGLGALAAAPASATGGESTSAGAAPLTGVIPAPSSVRAHGSPYEITKRTAIRIDAGSREAREVGDHLAQVLRPSTGYALPVTTRHGGDAIRLELSERERGLGAEGYRLTSGRGSLTVTAKKPAGLFHGVQTLRQLLPARAESDSRQRGPWLVAGGTIEDTPAYAYRGAMLDVSRHFLTVGQVKRYIDQLALYKMNKLHLHLSDDQGWRIAIDSWPRLTTYGGSTEVGGGPGGYYTKADYKEIVGYAASRHLEVIPEIDMPSHTNAALASYAELNCDGVAPPLYTGTEVGFSSLCAGKEVTYDFVDDVIRELAALTPGKYIHIGGDEAHSTSHEDYATLMNRIQPIVTKYGKTVMGWHQLTGATPVKGAVAQYWGYDSTGADERAQVVDAAKKGTPLVISPADRAYLDMKYDKNTKLGLSWAGYVSVERSYDWNPATYLAGAPTSSVLGVEAPLWGETLKASQDLETMAFPRLPGIAELGWSKPATHDWDTYRTRLAAQGPRWDALGITYYRSPEVPWPAK